MGLGLEALTLGRVDPVPGAREPRDRGVQLQQCLAGPAQGEQLDAAIGLRPRRVEHQPEFGVLRLGLCVRLQRLLMGAEQSVRGADVVDRVGADGAGQRIVGGFRLDGLHLGDELLADVERVAMPAEVVENLHSAELGPQGRRRLPGPQPLLARLADQEQAMIEIAALGDDPRLEVADLGPDVGQFQLGGGTVQYPAERLAGPRIVMDQFLSLADHPLQAVGVVESLAAQMLQPDSVALPDQQVGDVELGGHGHLS